MSNLSPSDTPLRILFFGTPEYAAIQLRALLEVPHYQVVAVITQPDKAAGRGRKLTPPPVKHVALEHNIPVLQPERIKKDTNAFLEALRTYEEIDIAVVSAFGQILPQQVLDFPKSTISVNTHASLLPRWRGAAPIQRAIMSGDTKTGICLMDMEADLDTGGVYSLEEVDITPQDTAQTLHDKLAISCASLLQSDLGKIATGELQARAQSTEGITYAGKITVEEARVDWTRPGHQVSCHIRGLSPFPGAHTTFRGKRLKIYFATAKVNFSQQQTLSPGQVHMVDKRTLAIQCGEGVVEIEQLQLEGKKLCSASDFIRGHTPTVGETFG